MVVLRMVSCLNRPIIMLMRTCEVWWSGAICVRT